MTVKKDFWVLLSIFILPIAIGTLFFYLNPTYFSQNTVNYGELIRPVITTEKTDIEFKDDATFNGFWTLAYVSKACDSFCEQAVADIKTIRTLINMDMRRIQRVLITENGSLPMSNDENLLIAKVTNEKLATKLAKFPENSIFLIDPIGNFMLYYNSTDINIKFVLKDLKRLLKYSRIG
jgi:cytochrome oxidase Cu insertion factor (SCO1/SenC/PrrC family)